MKCSKCGKTSNVSIGNRIYCTNCGAVISEQPQATPTAPPATATIAAPPPAVPVTSAPAPTLTDIAVRPSSGAPTAPPAAQVPTTPVALVDSKPVPPAAPRLTDIAAPRPATDYHAQPIASPPAAVAPITTATPSASPAAEAPLLPVTEHTSIPLPTELIPAADPKSIATASADAPPVQPPTAVSTPTPPAVSAAPSPAATLSGNPTQRLDAAKLIPKSDNISKFQPQPDTDTVAPAVPAPTGSELPAPAVTQHEALTNLITPAAAPSDQSLNLAMATAQPKRPNGVATAAAALVVVVMGGYIWLQNYPHLQLSAVAGKAGFTASLPGYLPSSYGLKGPIKYQTGEVSLSYQAPGQPGLSITQQLTTWDSKSLLDNYVAKQSSSYTTVQSQGLSIYLYGKNDAAWVNGGIWYSITGAANLSRSQILQIADSL